jgi:hypothetical protein
MPGGKQKCPACRQDQKHTVSKDIRVRIDGFVKIMAMVLPANGLKLSSRCRNFSLTCRCRRGCGVVAGSPTAYLYGIQLMESLGLCAQVEPGHLCGVGKHRPQLVRREIIDVQKVVALGRRRNTLAAVAFCRCCDACRRKYRAYTYCCPVRTR